MFRSQIRGEGHERGSSRPPTAHGRHSFRLNPNWHRLATGLIISPTSTRVQTQSEINTPGDEYEQEADAVANRVMRIPEPSAEPVETLEEQQTMPSLQRTPAEASPDRVSAENTPAIQTKRLPSNGHQQGSNSGRSMSGGEPLPTSVRSYFEPRFGHDFTSVRIHTGGIAADTAKQVQAKAFTFGHHIVFGEGHYRPETDAGRHLLAHELTHVIQQRGGNSPNLQRQPESSSPSLTEPNLGSLTFRLREDGQIEIVAGAPEAPVAGSLGIGARRQPDGRWMPVFGRNPATTTESYSWPEILDLVRGSIGATPVPVSPGLLPPNPLTPPSSISGLPGGLAPPTLTPPRIGPTLPPLTLGEPRLDIRRAQREILDNFAFDQSALTQTHLQTLDRIAFRLRMDNVRLVLITGHTDTTGSEAYNESLARRRAEAVRDALVERGVEASRLVIETSGEMEPAVSPERSEADRARNRRVELFWLRSGATTLRYRLGIGGLTPPQAE